MTGTEGSAAHRRPYLNYEASGEGTPIILLHGNPTSSYLWRQAIPVAARHGRAIAPDLLGMGSSPKADPPEPRAYRYVQHRRHLDALLEFLGVHEDVVLVGHDWGGVLAVDWARRHSDGVRGLVLTETMVAPRSLDDEDEGGRALFSALRSAAGEQMVLEDNIFIEEVLAGAAQRLSAVDLDVYRAPHREPGLSRLPMLVWAREIPFDGHPRDVHDILAENRAWLEATDTPVLFVSANPGAILVGPIRDWLRSLPNVKTVEVDAGHFVPEDAPADVAAALDNWLAGLST
jgi:haloalkane dehalogenase